MTRSEPDQRSPGGARDSAPPDSASHEIIAMLDTIDVPIVVVARDCTLARINRAATETFALASTDIGRRLNTIAALGDVKDIEKLCGQVVADNAPSRRDVRSGDRRFLLRAAAYATASGETAGVVLTFTNVTAFRASVEQAIYEREYTKAILNTVATPLVVLDGQLRVQSGNRAFYSTFGVSRERAQGVALRDLGAADWQASDLWAALAALVSGGDELQPFEIARECPAAGRRTLLFDARRVTGEGDAATLLLAAQDITERKHTEVELQSANRRKDEFLALLAHELRNPLAPILVSIEILRRAKRMDVTDQERLDLSPRVDHALEVLQRQVGQMVRLVDDLLDAGRIGTGKIDLRRERVELSSVMYHVVDAVHPLTEQRSQELTITLPTEPLYLSADPTRLAQIVGNLLNNASKFTDRGGHIWLTVERSDEGQGVDAETTPGIVIRVRDNGTGVPADRLERIFDMFTQIDVTLERSVAGLGIGLTLVKTLAELHGGTVEATSPGVGHGSEFIVRLPIVLDAALPAPRPMPIENIVAPLRILIVDDNRDSADMLATLLTFGGHETHTAHDGLAAVEAVHRLNPNVVVLDIGLPVLNGYDAARRIREVNGGGGRPFLIALTGWGQDEDRTRSKEAGFDAHLVKPIDEGALTRLLAELRSDNDEVQR